MVLPTGLHEITLTVTDNDGASDTDTVTIFVNAKPVADAGEDQTVTDTDDSGSELVTLNGTGSTDDTGIASYSWSENGTEFATVASPEVDFPVGEHEVTLTVTDDNGATSTDTVTILVQAAVSAEVVIAIEPQTTNTVVGQQFDVEIEVRAGDQQVDGAAAYINFDPSLLQVVSITPGSTLDSQLRNEVDNDAGEISLAYGTFAPFPSGTFTLATVTFEATNATAGTPLAFNSERPRKTNATFGGQSVLSSAVDGTVVIESASLTASVTLEGRADSSGPAWSIPLTVDFYEPSTDTLVQAFTPTTDENGEFVLTGIAPGTYDIAVKNSHTLQNVVTNVTIVSGTGNQVNLGTLREGDANNDNFVDLVDFSLLTTGFDTCQGDADFDERADFNEDGCVALGDFSLLTNHFDEAGDTVPAGTLQAASAPQDGSDSVALLGLVAGNTSSSTSAVGEQFALELQLQTGTQMVDASALMFTFDPSIVRVLGVEGGDAFDKVLLSEVDNATGRVRFEAGKLGGPFPSGDFSFVTLRFESVRVGDAQLALGEETTTLRSGIDVLGERTVPNVTVRTQQPTERVFLPLTFN